MEIAILLPCYQPPTLATTLAAIEAQLNDCRQLWPQIQVAVWLINDGASPQVAEQIAKTKAQLPDHRCLTLSRHFGYTAAVQAGLATIAAPAYLVIDPQLPEMVGCIPALIDALVVGGYDIVGFSHRHRLIFHDCAFTAVAKRALLQNAAQGEFSLAQLAVIGFKQKQLRWHGPQPPSNRQPLIFALAVIAVLILLSLWPKTSLLLNIGLLAVIIWQWYPRQHIRYVVAKSD
ncbi:glycosyltransferase family protein [Lacticaseibacillus sp. GG6-2]